METTSALLLPARGIARSLPFFFVLLLLAGHASLSAQPGRKFALLIGIGNYPQEGGWQHINSTNDLAVISDALRRRGVPNDNIFLMKDQQATRAGILNMWKSVFLPRLQRGDVVYFQFSGHGQQVADDNGDELDGYDEAIVPYDSPLRYQAGVYQGENLIRDDELNNLFTDLRGRLGPSGNLMVVLDACHSGTGTRGMAPARGTDVAMASDEYKAAAARRSGDGQMAPQFGAVGASELAPMVAYFGAAHNQLNFEARDEQGQLLGSLTYALSKKLSEAPPSTTYRGLFDQIRTEMSSIAPNQQPQVEGALDQELLGGRLLERPSYYSVVRWNDPGSVVVNAGWIQSLNEGAVVGLFPAETRDPARATPLAKGTVTRALPFEATLELDSSLREKQARSCWVYVLEPNFGDLHIGLAIQLPESHPVRQALLSKITPNSIIRLDETPEVHLVASGAGAQLIGAGDMLVAETSASLSPDIAAERLLERLKVYARARYFRKLEMRGSYLNVDFEIVPVRVDPRTGLAVETLPLDSKRDPLGTAHFKNGDAFRFRVTNRGDKAAYFTIMDIMPDNNFATLIPGEKETPAEFRVGPGRTVDVPNLFTIGPPAGVEMFKLIATEEPVDLRPIVRGISTRGPGDSPVKKMLDDVFSDGAIMTRGASAANTAAGAMHIYSTTFIIDK